MRITRVYNPLEINVVFILCDTYVQKQCNYPIEGILVVTYDVLSCIVVPFLPSRNSIYVMTKNHSHYIHASRYAIRTLLNCGYL